MVQGVSFAILQKRFYSKNNVGVMKKLFYTGIAGLALFEIANVYFIMPLPGSQRMGSLDLAYFLYHWRWIFRGTFALMIAAGAILAFRGNTWLASGVTLALAAVIYVINFRMAADQMFEQVKELQLSDRQRNKVNPDKLVLGIAINGQARAYPIQYMGYHHQLRDTLAGTALMVTYCTVCRTGRIFSPVVNGNPETFRLVGMDHFNAMFEDSSTKSWWRQATGEAVAGPLKSAQLSELPSTQTTLRQWLELYPNSLVMQADSTFSEAYADMDSYDTGLKRGKLTGTDTLSWHDKSWVVGIEIDRKNARAFDWNTLKKERIINEKVGETPILVVLAADNKSFFAFRRPDSSTYYSIAHDTIFNGARAWDLLGNATDRADKNLERINARQEFWHSWSVFHPHTTRY